MGLQTILFSVSVAVATRVSMQQETGTAFVEQDPVEFYQDVIRTTINMEIKSPRLMLKHEEYKTCDTTLFVNGIPLCMHQFDEFDKSIFEFMDLGLLQAEKDRNIQALNKTLHNAFERKKQATIDRLRHQIKGNNDAAPKRARRSNHDGNLTSRLVSNHEEYAEWTATINVTVDELNNLAVALCSVIPTGKDHNCSVNQFEISANWTFPAYDKRDQILEILQNFAVGTALLTESYIETRSTYYSLLSEFFQLSDKEKQLSNGKTIRELSGKYFKIAHVIQRKRLELKYDHPLPTATKQLETHHIEKRSPAAVAAGVAVVSIGTAIGGYFIGKSQAQVAMEELRDEMARHKQSILDLNSAVQASEKGIDRIAKMLQIDPNLIITGENSLPFDINFEASAIKKGQLNTRYDVGNSLHISKLNSIEFAKHQSYILNLQNSRLPLDKNFLLALRAECLAVQLRMSAKHDIVCNDLSFYSTRWDSGLVFNGLGLTFIDEKETMIRSIVYQFTVDIPVIYGNTLDHIKLVNLGRFSSPNTITQVQLPEHGIITRSGVIHPFDGSPCIRLSVNTICPTQSILTYDPCLHSIYNGTIASSCKTKTLLTETSCAKKLFDDFAVITLASPATLHYDTTKNRHMHETHELKQFDIVNRTSEDGVIFCNRVKDSNVPPELQIPKRKVSMTSNYTVNLIFNKGYKLSTLKSSDDRLQQLELNLESHARILAKSTKKLEERHYNTNSTLQKFKTNINEAIKSFPTTIKDDMLKLLTPIIAPIAALAIVAFIVMIGLSVGISACRKSMRNLNKPGVFTIPPTKNQHNSRVDDTTV